VKKLLSMSIVLAFVLSCSMVATTPVAAADPITVGPEGPPTYDYTSIQDAVNAASDGDTIHVYPGEYKETVEIDEPNLTLQAVDEHGDVIDATEHTADPLVTVDADGEDHAIRTIAGEDGANLGEITVEGFTVINWDDGGIILGGREGTFGHVLRNYVYTEIEGVRQPIQVSGYGSTVIGNEVKAPAILAEGWAAAGILAVDASNTLIQGNTVYGNEVSDVGISVANYWDGLYSGVATENNTIDNNKVSGCDHGIRIMGVEGNVADTTITNNELEGNRDGITVSREVTGTVIEYNVIEDSAWSGVVSIANLGLTPSGTQINYNNIVDSGWFGVESLSWDGTPAEEDIDARYNWWGDASGPEHVTNPGGKGDEVSDNVVFMPWLMEEDGAETTETNTESGEDAKAETANVSAEATGGDETTTVSVGEYVAEPTGLDPGFVVNDVFFFDVHVGGEPPNELVVEVECPGADCAGMVLKWFDGTEWLDVTPAAVDENGVFRFTLDAESSPTIAELTGTPFGLGNPEPPPVVVGWEGSPVNRLAVLAPWIALLVGIMASATLLVVRRRRAQT